MDADIRFFVSVCHLFLLSLLSVYCFFSVTALCAARTLRAADGKARLVPSVHRFPGYASFLGSSAHIFRIQKLTCQRSVLSLGQVAYKYLVLSCHVLIDAQVILLALGIWHVGIPCGVYGTFIDVIVLCRPFSVVGGTAGSQDAVDVSL